MLSLSSSIFSMAWCIASYHRCIRLSQIDKINISWVGSIIQSGWHLTVTGILTLVLPTLLYRIQLIKQFIHYSNIFSISNFVHSHRRQSVSHMVNSQADKISNNKTTNLSTNLHIYFQDID